MTAVNNRLYSYGKVFSQIFQKKTRKLSTPNLIPSRHFVVVDIKGDYLIYKMEFE